MTFYEFDKFHDQLFNDCLKMRNTKGKEYAHDTDRFSNFKRIAKELDLDPLDVAYVYFKKHLDSIISFIKDNKVYSTEPIRGRFIDAIVYLSLMAGMAEEIMQGLDDTKIEDPDIYTTPKPKITAPINKTPDRSDAPACDCHLHENQICDICAHI